MTWQGLAFSWFAVPKMAKIHDAEPGRLVPAQVCGDFTDAKRLYAA